MLTSKQLKSMSPRELGHGMPGGDNHLAESYHEGLCKLGAKARPARAHQTGAVRVEGVAAMSKVYVVVGLNDLLRHALVLTRPGLFAWKEPSP
jgi:hypothetical protein